MLERIRQWNECRSDFGRGFPWADLRSADLDEADLRSADLRSANLDEANLRGAKGIRGPTPQPAGPRNEILTAVSPSAVVAPPGIFDPLDPLADPCDDWRDERTARPARSDERQDNGGHWGIA